MFSVEGTQGLSHFPPEESYRKYPLAPFLMAEVVSSLKGRSNSDACRGGYEGHIPRPTNEPQILAFSSLDLEVSAFPPAPCLLEL